MKLSPGLVVIWTTIRSDSTVVPPVTALRSPPDSRMTGRGLAGDGRLVDGGDALDDVAVAGDDLAGLDDDPVADAAGRVPGTRSSVPSARSRRAIVSRLVARRRRRLGLAAALGDRLGRVGEQHGRPEPEGDRPAEDAGVLDRQAGGEDRADPHDEDDRASGTT